MEFGNYRLELRWSEIDKKSDFECLLKEAYFFGPALKKADKIEAPNYLTIDLTPQFFELITGGYYFVTLIWESVEYKDDKVFLGNAKLSSSGESNLKDLNQSDFFIIDTKDHEDEKHLYNLVYKGKILKAEGEDSV